MIDTNIADSVALRLRAMKEHFGVNSDGEFGALCCARPTTVGQWMQGANRPKVTEAIMLREKWGITLDWIYRGRVASMNCKLAAMLERIMENDPVRKSDTKPGVRLRAG